MVRPVGLDRMGRDPGGPGPERMDRMGRGEPMGRGGRGGGGGGRDAGPQRGGRAPQMQRRDDRLRAQDNGARSLSASQRREPLVRAACVRAGSHGKQHSVPHESEKLFLCTCANESNIFVCSLYKVCVVCLLIHNSCIVQKYVMSSSKAAYGLVHAKNVFSCMHVYLCNQSGLGSNLTTYL
jgi:hypothetical protein